VAAAALPTDFFDNPQQDPANKGKEVAATRKEQTLRDEMEEFQKQVSVSLEEAALLDAEDLEEEAVASMREEAFTQVLLEERVSKLRKRLASAPADTPARQQAAAAPSSAVEAGPSAMPSVAQTHAPDAEQAADMGTASHAGGIAVDDDDDDDDDEVEDGGLSALDWRTKGF